MKELLIVLFGISLCLASKPSPCKYPSDCGIDPRCFECAATPDIPELHCVTKASAVGKACNDRNPLTKGDVCHATGGCYGIAINLKTCLQESDCAIDVPFYTERVINVLLNTSADPQCVRGHCLEGMCKYAFAVGAPCNDGNTETSDDMCQCDGTCKGKTGCQDDSDCPDTDCGLGVCNKLTGQCSVVSKPYPTFCQTDGKNGICSGEPYIGYCNCTAQPDIYGTCVPGVCMPYPTTGLSTWNNIHICRLTQAGYNGNLSAGTRCKAYNDACVLDTSYACDGHGHCLDVECTTVQHCPANPSEFQYYVCENNLCVLKTCQDPNPDDCTEYYYDSVSCSCVARSIPNCCLSNLDCRIKDTCNAYKCMNKTCTDTMVSLPADTICYSDTFAQCTGTNVCGDLSDCKVLLCEDASDCPQSGCITSTCDSGVCTIRSRPSSGDYECSLPGGIDGICNWGTCYPLCINGGCPYYYPDPECENAHPPMYCLTNICYISPHNYPEAHCCPFGISKDNTTTGCCNFSLCYDSDPNDCTTVYFDNTTRTCVSEPIPDCCTSYTDCPESQNNYEYYECENNKCVLKTCPDDPYDCFDVYFDSMARTCVSQKIEGCCLSNLDCHRSGCYIDVCVDKICTINQVLLPPNTTCQREEYYECGGSLICGIDGKCETILCTDNSDCPQTPCRSSVCTGGICNITISPSGAACQLPGTNPIQGLCDNYGTCYASCINGQCPYFADSGCDGVTLSCISAPLMYGLCEVIPYAYTDAYCCPFGFRNATDGSDSSICCGFHRQPCQSATECLVITNYDAECQSGECVYKLTTSF